MRPLLLALCTAVVVLFTASSARAEGSATQSFGRCRTQWMSDAMRAWSDPELVVPRPVDPGLSQAPAPSRAMPAMPGQSRAPIMCTDPSQPGCHVDVPDAPHHHGVWLTAHDAVWSRAPSLDLPPPECVSYTHAEPNPGVPGATHAPAPWRPPSR